MQLAKKYATCSVCSSEDMLLYRKSPKMCKACYFKDKMERAKSKSKNLKPKKKSFIAPISDKRAEGLAKYRGERDAYLKEFTECEVHDCNNPSSQIHHKAGRNGSLLWDREYFMACCGVCHPQRIHENPKWARECGYIVDVDLK